MSECLKMPGYNVGLTIAARVFGAAITPSLQQVRSIGIILWSAENVSCGNQLFSRLEAPVETHPDVAIRSAIVAVAEAR